jgi:hypothetical protein
MGNCRRDCWRESSRHPNLQISLDMHAPEAIELLRTGKIDVAIMFRYDETDPEPAAIRPIPCSTTPCTSCHRARNGPLPTCATRRGSPAAIASPRSTSGRVKSKKDALPPLGNHAHSQTRDVFDARSRARDPGLHGRVEAIVRDREVDAFGV